MQFLKSQMQTSKWDSYLDTTPVYILIKCARKRDDTDSELIFNKANLNIIIYIVTLIYTNRETVKAY